MRHPILMVLAIVAGITSLYAQPLNLRQKMIDPQANFFQIRNELNTYYKNRDKGRGTGFKQYKRWEYYRINRVGKNGKMPSIRYQIDQIGLSLRSTTQFPKQECQKANWEEMGPAVFPTNQTTQSSGVGRVNAIGFHPTNADKMYAGAAYGGIWRTNDGGASWMCKNDFPTRIGVNSVKVHPNTPQTVYIGTANPGLGVWRSTNGGDTWEERNTGMGDVTVHDLALNPDNPDKILAATSGGVFYTDDAGASWTEVIADNDCKDVEFRPGISKTAYAAGKKFYRSNSFGTSFTQITAGLPSNPGRMKIGVSPDDHQRVYVVASKTDETFLGLYRSNDYGTTFTRKSSSPNILGYENDGSDSRGQLRNITIAVEPNDASVIYVGGINIWKSTNAGQTWTCMTHWSGDAKPEIHADQNFLGVNPLNGALYNGNDGGVYLAVNQGFLWVPISNGLGIGQMYKLGQSATKRNYILTGHQDNGTNTYETGSWIKDMGGDGMECAYDHTDHKHVYATIQRGTIRRSVDGRDFYDIAGENINGIDEEGDWVTPFKIDPTNPNIMVAGFENVWLSPNIKIPFYPSLIVWNKVTSFSTDGNKVIDVAHAPMNGNILYFSREDGGGDTRLYLTRNLLDPNPTWEDLTTNLPVSGRIKDIEVYYKTPGVVWIAIDNTVYETRNFGATWTEFASGLPDISVNTIVHDQTSTKEELYLGNDYGVYYRNRDMTAWQIYNEGLPPIEVTELEIYYGKDRDRNVLRAATYGRGLWQSDMRCDAVGSVITSQQVNPSKVNQPKLQSKQADLLNNTPSKVSPQNKVPQNIGGGQRTQQKVPQKINNQKTSQPQVNTKATKGNQRGGKKPTPNVQPKPKRKQAVQNTQGRNGRKRQAGRRRN